MDEFDWIFDVPFSTRYLPVEFVYDGAIKRTRIAGIKALSLDPADYADGIKTTSELLRFGASIAWVGPTAFGGQLEWYQISYGLLKLIIDLLDHGGIDLGSIRVNVNDYEEWDYVNSAFDLEFKTYLQTGPHKRGKRR